MRVLAVDDDALVLMSTAMMLEELGHEVVEATSGDDALRELEAGQIDVVVTDFMMPGMTGYELMQKIRARTPDLPVLIVSGFVNLPVDVQRQVPLLPSGDRRFQHRKIHPTQRIHRRGRATEVRRLELF